MQAILSKGRTWSTDAFDRLSLSTSTSSSSRRQQQQREQAQQQQAQEQGDQQQAAAEAMEGLVLRSLAKIRKLVGSSSRKHKALRDACDTVIGTSVRPSGWGADTLRAHAIDELVFNRVDRPTDPHTPLPGRPIHISQSTSRPRAGRRMARAGRPQGRGTGAGAGRRTRTPTSSSSPSSWPASRACPR